MSHRVDGLRVLLGLAAAVTLGVLVATGVAVGQDASTSEPTAKAAVGEGAAIRGGVRNPGGSRRNELREETQIIADTGRNEYGTRQSNKGEGGGAIYGCRARLDANDPVDPRRSTACMRSSNLSNGEAFQFTTDGVLVGVFQVGDTFAPNTNARPFITNATGVATGLNADEVDGQDATDIVAQAREKRGLAAESADNAARLEGQPASAFEPNDTLRTRGVVTVAEGASAELLRYGPFVLSGACAANGGNTDANVTITSSANDAAVAGDNTQDGDLDAGETFTENVTGDAPAPGDPDPSTLSSPFTGLAGTAAFTSRVQAVADATTGTCRFHGNLTVDG